MDVLKKDLNRSVPSYSANKIKKVLLTGSNGFIGRHLHQRLTKIAIDVQTGYGSVSNELDDIQDNTNIDITNINNLHSIDRGAEAIIHLAAKASVPDSFNRPYESYHTNILGTLNLLEIARLRNIRKFIFVSTYIYGQPKYLPVDEKHQVNPHSPYQTSKLIAEQLCQNYSKDFGIDIVTLRPFYIYGPNSRPYSFIPSAIKQIKKTGKVILSGEQTSRDFLFVNDFVDLIVSILRTFPSGHNVYNVGYGKSYSLKEVAQILARILNTKITIKFDAEMRRGDIISTVADISKVSGAFNWKPSIDLETGLELIVRNSRE